MYVEASGPDHIGDVAFFDNNVRVTRTHLPEWLSNLGGIYEFEMGGAISGLTLVNVSTPGRPIAICIDNAAASGPLVRWYSDTPIGRSIASIFWSAAAHFSFPVWIGQVRSKLNAADPPSRACACIPEAPTLKPPNYGVPDNFRAIFESHESIARHLFTIGEWARSFPEGGPFQWNHNAETS